MGKSFDYVPTQLTKAFRDVQSNEQFQGWLKMQEAAMEIQFPYDDLPEVREEMFAKDSLAVVEQKLLELYDSHRTAFAPENIHTTMRYAYYIGEIFRRACDGNWVNVPVGEDFVPAVDFPMREAMIRPADLIKGAVNRRTGKDLSVVFGHAERDYREWVDAGKPERIFLGSLRED